MEDQQTGSTEHADRENQRMGEVSTADEFVTTTPFQRLVDLLDSDSITIGLSGPRGTGKTTLLKQAFNQKSGDSKARVGLAPDIRLLGFLTNYLLPDFQKNLLLLFVQTIFWKIVVLILLFPLFLPILGDILRRLVSPNSLRPLRPEDRKSNRGSLSIDPFSVSVPR